MASTGSYSKGLVRKLMVNGVDLTQSTLQVYTGTSILAPWQVGKILVTDASRIQDALYQPGVPVQMVYSAADGSVVREFEFVTLGNMAGMKIESNRSGGTTIACVSQSYFNMQNEHSSSHQNVTAADALKRLHKEVDPKASLTVGKTKGMIGDQEAFLLSSVKLGQGCNNIRSRMTDEKYKSAAFVYYRDQNGEYHAQPIEKLFEDADGPTFTQHMGGKSFLSEQKMMATNIFAFQKGGAGQNYGTDNAGNYQSTLKQRGGDPGSGFDWGSMTYTPPTSKDYKPEDRKTPGDTTWAGQKQTVPSETNHKFMYDSNMKTQEDFEGDTANRNVMSAISMQGSTLFNVPLEGGIDCIVGKGCNLDIPSEVGTGGPAKSTAGGKHLILAMGEYLILNDNHVTAYSAIQTASGGTQGGIV